MNDNNTNEIENEVENLMLMKRELLRNEWVEEAKQIPLYDVTDGERELLLKCINREEFSDLEVDALEKIVGRYRDAIEKYQPAESLENTEKNIQYVSDEKELLRLMKKSHDEQILYFNYPLMNDEIIRIKLIVNNEIDAEALDDLQSNLQLFTDLTEDEKKVYQKYSHDGNMTREERVIAEQLERKIQEKSINNISGMRKTAIEFLSKQTRLADQVECDEATMKEIYTEMKLGYLMALFKKVNSMVGITNIETDELFQ